MSGTDDLPARHEPATGQPARSFLMRTCNAASSARTTASSLDSGRRVVTCSTWVISRSRSRAWTCNTPTNSSTTAASCSTSTIVIHSLEQDGEAAADGAVSHTASVSPQQDRPCEAWPAQGNPSKPLGKRRTNCTLECQRPALPLEQLAELHQRARVGYVPGLQAGTPGLIDAELHVPQFLDRVRVGIDNDADATFLRRHQGRVVQVEAIRLGVQLQQTAVVGRRLEDYLQVHVIALALADQPASRVTDGMYMRALDGIQEPPGDLLPRLVLAVVDGGDHPVGLREHVLGQVQPAVLQDVQLHPLEQGDPVDLAGQLVDGLPVLAQAFSVKPSGHRDALGMVGEGDVGVAAFLRALHHLLQGGPAIGGSGVHVQIAAQVVQLQQLGKPALRGQLEYAAGLTQLGRDPRQADRLVDLFLGAACDASLAAEDPVFVDSQPALQGPAA